VPTTEMTIDVRQPMRREKKNTVTSGCGVASRW
jgi:hypothetical protein